jgi:hypothetical protein
MLLKPVMTQISVMNQAAGPHDFARTEAGVGIATDDVLGVQADD